MKRSFEYKVFHGWAFPEYEVSFKSEKKALEFILSQKDSDCWCYDRYDAETGEHVPFELGRR